MKKSIVITLFIVNCSLSVGSYAATCPAGWIQQNDNSDVWYKIVDDKATCGTGWSETNDPNFQPFLPAGSDSKGNFSETICTQ